ncbi:leucine-rich repeat and guanylate kinase domain-containing protein isoform X2 [Podarcis raffonei]|uniref:leucine-rich repeat and guanylate kinase domain-containing protein isoform X2 n=1 Tax=Podarcis raffonei TaxID=65483 RepID=UPI0023291A3D|nr:leucine-rich repeat and guanylate kinase domain-containing protein isoform X2 [Podarcis raffonei]
MHSRSPFYGRSAIRSAHSGDDARSGGLRSWATSPSVTFSLLLSRFDERFPRGIATEGLEGSATFNQEDEEELAVEEEESTESEPEPEPMEEEFDGVLTEEMTAEALQKLGRSAPGTEHVYLDLSLSDRKLSDISILCRYVHLEKLDLSYNKIDDISCVSYMPYLLDLNVSHNELTTYFDFKPPKNLQVADFSHNKIQAMQDLSAYQSLKKLILDDNEIEEIQGLENCQSLTYLSLADNKITAINGLKNLPIKTLCLKSNQIAKAVGLEELKVLQKLDLSDNQISSLEGLEEHNLLEEINLEDNRVAELGELEYFESLPLLRVLNLINNPVQEHKDYWLLVIFMLLRLTELDHKKITVQEKVAAVNKYDPPPEVVAAQDHMTQIMYSMIQPQRIFDSTLPSLDAPYPMLVLTGPLACWKRELCHRLCRKFNNYFRYSPCHTTRTAYFGEENRLDYYFVSQEEFDKMVTMGKFIATFKYSGFYYGMGRDTIESIAREGLATCIHMEIEGVRSLKNSYFQPRYILLIPVNKERYGGQLRRMGLFSRAEIEEAVRRVGMYIQLNQDFPGFFDAVINVDDFDEAFTNLSKLIEEFLGIKQPSETEVKGSASDTNLLSVPNGMLTVPPKTASVKGTDGVAPSPTPSEFLDSSAKNYSAVISARLSAEKTPVEEASLQRRQQTAKQGLTGKAVSSYSQLFQSYFDGTSAAVGLSHARFLEPPSQVSILSPRKDSSPDRGVPPASPDRSPREAHGTPRYSLSLSPGALSSKSAASQLPPAAPVPSAEEMDEATLSPESKEKKAPKPKPPPPAVRQLVDRPGSNTKPVLPPIPSGRKRNKPAAVEGQPSSVLSNPKPSS